MRPGSVAWERAREVHEAALGWLRVGAIDAATERVIRAAFPDPCTTPSLVWRALTAGMVSAIVLCAFGAFALAGRFSSTWLQVPLFFFAIACLVATEVLEASPRFARRGAAGATSFWGVAFLLGGLGLFLLESRGMAVGRVLDALLLASALGCGAASWRWGSPFFTALSATSLFLFLARLPTGRGLWILTGTALTALGARHLDTPSWAPSHRRSAAILVVAGLLAVYGAVNVFSVQEHGLERFVRFGPISDPAPWPLVALSALATTIVPLVVLAWGARSRRTFVLDIGIVLCVLSLVTLRHYVHWAPLWVVLACSGAALVLLVLAVERALRRAPGGVIAEFTADPLFTDERKQQALQIVPVVAAFTAPAAAAEEKDFASGGGRFGGGGASEKF